MIQLVYWEIWEACFESEMMVIIAKAHLAQWKIVQYIGTSPTLASVDAIDEYEHGTITCFLYAQVNCDPTIFRDIGVDWIARETLVIIFIIKNIYILFVKQSENKMTSCLAHYISQSGCIIDILGIYPDCVWVFKRMHFVKIKMFGP